MYLCFIDESGTAPKPTAQSPRPYFVIAAVVMHEAQWHGVQEELQRLRDRRDFWVRAEIKWRFFGSENTDPDNSVAHLDQTERNAFRRHLFEILVRRKSIKTLACVTSVQAAYKMSYISDSDDLYAYTYKVVSERFQYFLQDISRSVGDKQLGIIIADHRGKKQDDLLRKEHHKMLSGQGVFTSSYENYIETIFLTPSHLSVGIQFADMVAGAINRKYNSNDSTWFDVIKPTIRSSPNGKIDGYGIMKFPKVGWV